MGRSFARGILGLHHADGISNAALLAELGLEPIRARWYKLRLGYWWRNLNYNPERFVRKLTIDRYNETKANENTIGWCATTRDLLAKVNLLPAWENSEECELRSKDSWKGKVYTAVELHALTNYVRYK